MLHASERRTVAKHAVWWLVAAVLIAACGSSGPQSVKGSVRAACLSATATVEPTVEKEVQTSQELRDGKLSEAKFRSETKAEFTSVAAAVARLDGAIARLKPPRSEAATVDELGSAIGVLQRSVREIASLVAKGDVAKADRSGAEVEREVTAINRVTSKFGFDCVL